MGGDVTGTRERVWERPLDRGKFWEPAHLYVILIVLSLSDVSAPCSDAPVSLFNQVVLVRLVVILLLPRC